MNGKGRPEKLTDKFRRLITARQEGRKKKLKAPAVQEEIKLVIEQCVRKEASEKGWSEELIKEQIKDKLPGISSIQKYLKEIDPGKVYLLDNPWHIGTLDDYPLPSEAIRYVLELQSWVKRNGKQPLTILHALWASRLYSKVCGNKIKEKELQNLWGYSGGYAWYDRICKMSGTNTDTTILDEAVMGLREWKDALFSLIAPVELKEGRCSPELLAWLLNKTKDDPEQRTKLYEILHISTEKDGEK